MVEALVATRSRARHWSAVFDRLAKVLETLDKQSDRSLLARAFVFLVERSLRHLDAPAPLESARGNSGDEEDLVFALELAQSESGRGRDAAGDEIEMLVALAHAMLSSTSPDRFEDREISSEAIAAEFRAIHQNDAGALDRMELFPAEFRACCKAMRERFRQDPQPMRSLAREMTLMRVIRCLYALAIGYRDVVRGSRPDETARTTWLAFTLGEASLAQAG